MKLAIFIIALIACANAQAAAWVSPTTTLAKVYQSAAQKSAATASTNLKNAAATLKSAQDARKTAQVLASKWTDFTTAMGAVSTKRGLLGTQDTALATLVKTHTDAANTLAVKQVENQCQILMAKTRKAWQTQAALVSTAAGGTYATKETAFVAPETTNFNDLGTALKDSLTALSTAITNGKGATNSNAISPAPASGPAPKNWNIWTPTVAQASAATGSYQKLNCPYTNAGGQGDGAAAVICNDCSGGSMTPAANSPFVKAKVLANGCSWENMLAWSTSMGQTYSNTNTVNTAIGKWTALDNLNKNQIATATTGIIAKRDAYAAKLTSYATAVTGFRAQVDLLAGLLTRMQAQSALAMTNSGLMKTATADNAANALAISTAAGTASTAATAAVAALKTASDTAAGAVTTQWTALNTTVAGVITQMGKTRMAVGALGKANAMLMGALKAQGIAHELYTSSQASDTWATDQQKQLAALATLSKTDYDNVVAMKKASGSSMIQQTFISLLAGFVILLGYRKF